MRARRWILATSLVMAVTGASLLSEQTYLGIKAVVAEFLIRRAWGVELEDGRPHRPWPWADMHPVAQLEVPRIGVRRTILAGASGSTLAFGLGHLSGTALPGERGNCAIAGHRDTRAAFLRELRPGDGVVIESLSGQRHYRVTGVTIVTKEQVQVLDPIDDARLTLITCYPFSGLLRSPWRYVVTCEAARVPARSS